MVGHRLNEEIGRLIQRQDLMMQQIDDLERQVRPHTRTALKR